MMPQPDSADAARGFVPEPTPTASAAPASERELTSPVDLCDASGRLLPAAIGWTRRPLHRCNLSGTTLRLKKWEYWCATTDDHLFSLTYSSLGAVGLVSAWILEYATGRRVECTRITPLGMGLAHPETVRGAPLEFALLGLQVRVVEEPEATRLRVNFTSAGDTVDADLWMQLPGGHETLGVVVPWSERLFQYTSKHNTRPTAGRVRVNQREFVFGRENHAFGCLDFGRGRWPWRSAWNWASASGVSGGRTVGLNLGGKWTDSTGSTENAVCIDGRLHKISEDLEWRYDRRRWRAPWQIRAPLSGRVELGFRSFHERSARTELGLIGSDLHVLFGHFDGHVVTDEGERVEVRGIPGWAEEHLARW